MTASSRRYPGRAYRRDRTEQRSNTGLSNGSAPLLGGLIIPWRPGDSKIGTWPNKGPYRPPGKQWGPRAPNPSPGSPIWAPPGEGGSLGRLPTGGGWAPYLGGAAAGLARWGLRLIPVVGILVTAWWIYEEVSGWGRRVGHPWALRMYGYVPNGTCPRNPIGVSTGCGGCSSTSLCQTGNPTHTIWDGVSRPARLWTFSSSSNGAPYPVGRTDVTWTRTGGVRPRWLPPFWFEPYADPEGGEDLTPQRHVPGKPNPNVDPHSVPPGQPWPAPVPLPWRILPARKPNPYRDPNEQTRWGPKPVQNPTPQPGPPVMQPEPGTQPGPGTPTPPANPGPVVSPVWPKPGSQKPSHYPRPPRAREKEKKFRPTPAAASVVGRIINFATESADAIEAFWWALPPKYRSPPRIGHDGRYHQVGKAQMAKDIYDHFNHLDMNKAMHNLKDQMAEDLLFGLMGRGIAKSNAKMGKISPNWKGWAFGPAL